MIYFDIASLALGFAAWIVAAFCRKPARPGLSFCLCSLSLLCQLFNYRYLAFIGDWSAIEDISHALSLAAGILVLVTIGLNLLNRLLRR